MNDFSNASEEISQQKENTNPDSNTIWLNGEIVSYFPYKGIGYIGVSDQQPPEAQALAQAIKEHPQGKKDVRFELPRVIISSLLGRVYRGRDVIGLQCKFTAKLNPVSPENGYSAQRVELATFGTYPLQPPFNVTLKRFRNKGFGFFTPLEASGPDLFVHIKDAVRNGFSEQDMERYALDSQVFTIHATSPGNKPGLWQANVFSLMGELTKPLDPAGLPPRDDAALNARLTADPKTAKTFGD